MKEGLELLSWIDEMGAVAGGYELKFPTSLTDLYKYCNGIGSPFGIGVDADKMAGRIWASLCVVLYSAVNEQSKLNGHWATEDLVSGFLSDLFYSRSCPDEIDSIGILIKRAKKFAMETIDECGKEVNRVLHDGLRQLVRDGVVLRSDPDKCISQGTRFWLAEIDCGKVATPELCRARFGRVKRVGKDIRDYSTLKKRLLTPSEAKDVVVGLLKALGGEYAVTVSDFMACLKDRTKNIISSNTVSYEENDKCDGEDAEKDSDKEHADVRNESDELAAEAMMSSRFYDETQNDDLGKPGGFYNQNERIEKVLTYRERKLKEWSAQLADRIFGQVSQMVDGVKIMASYTLPEMLRKDIKKYPDWRDGRKVLDVNVKKSVVASDFGDARAVYDTNVKIREQISSIIVEELGDSLRRPNEYEVAGRTVAIETIREICKRCSEKGYDVILKLAEE